MEKKIIKKLTEALEEAFKKHQELLDQYIVLYKRKDNDELIGYHLNTFCNITKDVLKAKRYAGSDPYEQLAVISENLKSIFENYGKKTIFGPIRDAAREAFGDLNYEDIYLDVEYLADGMEPQDYRFTILTPDDLE